MGESNNGNKLLNSFAKLKGRANYDEWKVAAKSYLTIKGLWGVVKEEATESPETNAKAIGEITLMIEPSLYNYIIDSTSAKDVWDGIAKVFDDSGTARKVTILNQLVSIKLAKYESMETYVNEILLYWQKTKIAGFKIEEEVIASLMLGGLPEEYKAMILGIENSGKELTVDYVKTVLLQGIAEPIMKNETEHAMQVKSNRFMKRGSKFNGMKKKTRACYKCGETTHLFAICPKKDLTCFECGDIRHLARNCFKKKKPYKGKSFQQKASEPKSGKTLIALLNQVQKNHDIRDEWIMDSGASAHMCNNRNMFSTYREVHNQQITVANNETMEIKGTGDIWIKGYNNTSAIIKNVSFVPDICTNLMSVKQITDAGHIVLFSRNECSIQTRDGCVVGIGSIYDGMFKMNIKIIKGNAFFVNDNNVHDEIELWHRKLGHPGYASMKFLPEYDGKTLPKTNCKICLEAKQSKMPFKSSETKTDDILQLVHTDVNGPMQAISLGKHKYILTIIDDYSKKVFAFPIKSKSDVFDKFNEWRKYVENQTGKKLKAIRSDNGTEFINHKFDEMTKENGIMHQRTVVYTPQQNGIAERYNRTIMEKVRALLIDSGLNKELWAEAVNTAVYLINIIPKDKNSKPPNEKWNGEITNLEKLKIFGEKAMAHIPKEKRKDNKLDERATEVIFIGYAPNGYRLYDPNKREVIIRKDVIFIRKEGEKLKKIKEENEKALAIVNENLQVQDETQWNDEEYFMEYTEELNHKIEMTPKTYEEAMTDKNATKWISAMEEEYRSLMVNDTWSLSQLPDGKKAVKCKWVFAIKKDQNGKPIKYKARLVAKGYSQTQGIDYQETFAPVVRYTSIRFLLALAAHRNLEITQMDAVTAFLNGKLNEEIYMEQPKHFDDQTKRYCKLIKSIYGLKQSSRVWNETLNAVLLEHGLNRSKSDQCIYYLIEKEDIIIVAIYVDDFLIFTNNGEREVNLKKTLFEKFKMKDLGKAASILGIRIIRNEISKTISIDQTSYIWELLKRFKMEDCNSVSTPLELGKKISSDMCSKTEEEHENMKNIPYREAIGSLLFLAITTRPDINFAVNLLSRYCESPGRAHWSAIKRIFRYLKGTINFKLLYGQTNEFLTGYSDSDWASDLDERRSTTGYVFIIYGGAISWCTKRQPTIALSSTEAEYMALTSTIQEGIWLKAIYKEIFAEEEKITIFGDNKGALQVIENNSFSSRTKHMDIKYRFIKQKMDAQEIKIKYLSTNEMPADILTKAVSASKISKHSPTMGLNDYIEK